MTAAVALATDHPLARDLLARFALQAAEPDDSCRFLLRFRDDRLELVDRRRPRYAPLCVDFSGPSGMRRLRQGDPLLRSACRVRGVRAAHVLDATAGLGGDALALAQFGFRVTAVERCSAVAALLADGLRRAVDIPALVPLVRRIELRVGESAARLAGEVADCCASGFVRHPDVVYLDPMFGDGRRALPGGSMQILADLVGEDPDAPELLRLALGAARRKVVVKRHPKGAALLANVSRTVKGKQVRYDVYDVGSGRRCGLDTGR